MPLRHRNLSLALCCLLALTACDNNDDDDSNMSPSSGQFQWRMTERTRAVTNMDFKPDINVAHSMIEGPTPGQPGLYGGVASVPLDEINPPDGFELSFDACQSSAGADAYEWMVDGAVLTGATACRVTTRLPQGDHEVTLSATRAGAVDTQSQTIKVKDYLVVAMGDSYSSGEGNPTAFDSGVSDSALAEAIANNGAGWSEGGYWDHANCHRSTRSGVASAAIDLEQADPHSSVTFIYLACSGAQIDSGILGIKDGYLDGPEEPQVVQAHALTLARGREIDALLLGIGGNDIGFVPIVAECALQVDCFLSTEQTPGLTIPNLPVTDASSPVDPGALAALTLKPDAGFPDLAPGPPYRQLDPQALHACDATYQTALLNDGGIIPAQACRESIGPSPAGLAQVAKCINGSGDQDCVRQPSYYNFATGEYQYAGGETSPGLGVPPDRVFYTEYPDLTTRFADDGSGELEFCSISLTKNQLLILLEAARQVAEDPTTIAALIAAVRVLGPLELPNLGLTENEFAYASAAILGGVANPEPRVLDIRLTGDWNVRAPGGPLATTTIGPGQAVDFINLGTSSPALNEVTRLSESRYGWTPVLGTFDLASGHGLCARPPVIGVVPDDEAAYAYLIGPAEGTNVSGSAHPNLLGQEAYREPITATVRRLLGL